MTATVTATIPTAAEGDEPMTENSDYEIRMSDGSVVFATITAGMGAMADDLSEQLGDAIEETVEDDSRATFKRRG